MTFFLVRGRKSVAEMTPFFCFEARINGKRWAFAGGYAQSRGCKVVLMCSVFDEPHDPAGGDGADDE